ncbi:MAG: ATP-binding cassette domain-containing protein [Streptococcaceae bacterium]|jgi:ABC-type lipoprotein export system ATPase subunit/ABC-type antimicrobial peptide transport system permease subunit|nr:ATP-binding cassette domain-containing protein [Streptococcaceae bacterium]
MLNLTVHTGSHLFGVVLILVGLICLIGIISFLRRSSNQKRDAEVQAAQADHRDNGGSVLELKDIHKSYFLGKEEFPVLHGINLTFDRGDFVSLLGESGGGKSTLMNIIGGLDREYQGDVVVDGVAQKSKKEADMDAYRRDTIGFVFQSFNLVNYLSVLDNILIALKMTNLSGREQNERAIELAKQVGLYEHRKKKPAQLSGGQKQRVAIARALASDPEIILADEPTGALDSQNTREVLAILQDIAKQGKTVIVVTHSQEVADAGTRIIHLADGKINQDERIKSAYPLPDRTQDFETKALSYGAVIRTGFQHFTNKWKINLLIAIGTAIGLFSVIFFLGLGTGGTKYMNDMITSQVNPNVPMVVRRQTANNKISNDDAFSQAYAAMNQGKVTQTITQDDLNQLWKVKNVTSVEPAYSLAAQVTATVDGKTSSPVDGLGSWTSLHVTSGLKAGTKPSNGSVVIQERVAKQFSSHYKSLIGKTISLALTFQGTNGQPVQLTKTYKIAGVEPTSNQMSPISLTASDMKSLLSENGLSTSPAMVVLVVNDVGNVKSVVSDVQKLKDSSGNKIYATYSLGSILDTLSNITSIVSVVLAAIAGISLVVSIFMIVVTSYMSVAERTKEIGVFRALGARKKDISRLFRVESILLGLSAAILGIVVAFLAENGINHLLKNQLGGANIVMITLGQVIFAVVIALLIALFASWFPSRRAAKMNTIEALAAD